MAPTFRRGFPATFGFVIAALVVILGIQFMAVRERRKRSMDAEIGSQAGSSINGGGTDVDEKKLAISEQARNSSEAAKSPEEENERV